MPRADCSTDPGPPEACVSEGLVKIGLMIITTIHIYSHPPFVDCVITGCPPHKLFEQLRIPNKPAAGGNQNQAHLAAHFLCPFLTFFSEATPTNIQHLPSK